ncbi:MAG: RIP metalloprotease RseP, partial [bacterium]|nr:RIP metalloprotease RseP [bacterium]
MTILDYLFAVIPMLGILIFVHELGHFLVAKWCGVRVLKFSLGFGSPIGFGDMRLRWVRGGTEYVIAWFPLGGFVKMLGEQMQGVQ